MTHTCLIGGNPSAEAPAVVELVEPEEDPEEPDVLPESDELPESDDVAGMLAAGEELAPGAAGGELAFALTGGAVLGLGLDNASGVVVTGAAALTGRFTVTSSGEEARLKFPELMTTPNASMARTATAIARGEGSSSGTPNRVNGGPLVVFVAPPVATGVAFERSAPTRRGSDIAASVLATGKGRGRTR
jgi:hypothetical protein